MNNGWQVVDTQVVIKTKKNEFWQTITASSPFILHVHSERSGELRWTLPGGIWLVREVVDRRTGKYRVILRQNKPNVKQCKGL